MRIITLFLSVTLLSSFSFAQNTELQAVLDTKQFYLPDGSPYIETYINYIGPSLVYSASNTDTLFYAKVETTILLKSNNEIIAFRKFEISSPGQQKNYYSDFLDLQRFAVEPGRYDIEVQMQDLGLDNPITKEIKVNFEVFDSAKSKTISDIMLLEAWGQTDVDSDISKAGYNLLPFVSITYPGGASQLAFYTELYNFTDDDSPNIVYTGIRPEGGEPIDELQRIKKLDDGTINPILQVYPINELGSGSYELLVEIRDAKNEVQETRILPFYKLESPLLANNYLDQISVNQVDQLLASLEDKDSLKRKKGETNDASIEDKKKIIYTHFENKAENPRSSYFLFAAAYLPELLENQTTSEMFSLQYTNRDELYEYLHTLHPIAGAVEHNTLDFFMKTADLETMQQYLYYFWETRNPENPEGSWLEYKAMVEKADEEFGTRNKRGYMTDRGRVFLQYGQPNTRVERANDTDNYPYEIWHYYKIGAVSDGKFVFYNPSLGMEDYPLLHSNLRGEINNKQWLQSLYSGNQNVYDPLQQTTQVDGRQNVDFRNQPLDFYNNPR